jgi:hypothetical protein
LNNWVQLIGIDTGHRNVRTDAVHHQGEQQKDQADDASRHTYLFCG